MHILRSLYAGHWPRLILNALLAFFCALCLFTGAECAEKQKPPSAATPVIDSLEKLYDNYEVIDRRMDEINRNLSAIPGIRDAFTPFTMTVKKKPGFYILYLETRDNGTLLWSHAYTPIENSAMERNGRHIFYKTEISGGRHTFDFSFQYAYPDGATPVKKNVRWDVTAEKEPIFTELLFEIQDDEIILQARKLQVIEKD